MENKNIRAYLVHCMQDHLVARYQNHSSVILVYVELYYRYRLIHGN